MMEKELWTFDPMEIYLNGLKGYLLVVDLEYPSCIHDEAAVPLLAPEPMMMMEDMLTPHMKEQWQIINAQRGTDADYKFQGIKKLLLTQFDNVEYKVHLRVLKFHL